MKNWSNNKCKNLNAQKSVQQMFRSLLYSIIGGPGKKLMTVMLKWRAEIKYFIDTIFKKDGI